jgi:hypothetical protein
LILKKSIILPFAYLKQEINFARLLIMTLHQKKIALVTGANRGLGFEISLQLAKKKSKL